MDQAGLWGVVVVAALCAGCAATPSTRRMVAAERNAASFDTNQQARQAIIDAGGTVRELTAEQRQAWVDAMKPVWQQFEGDVGAENIEAAVDHLRCRNFYPSVGGVVE